MNYEDFDYLNGSLIDWVAKFDSDQEPRNNVKLIEDEFLPRFEQAIHRLNARLSETQSETQSETKKEGPLGFIPVGGAK